MSTNYPLKFSAELLRMQMNEKKRKKEEEKQQEKELQKKEEERIRKENEEIKRELELYSAFMLSLIHS